MHTNPFFNTREYETEFTDGAQYKYTMNLIFENMYAQVDDEGNKFQLLAEIQDHQKNGMAISKRKEESGLPMERRGIRLRL